MYYFLFGLIIAGYFYQDARKRGQNPVLWYCAAFTAYFIPYALIGGVFSSNMAVFIEGSSISGEEFQLYTFILIVFLGLALLIVAYKQLLKHRTENEVNEKIHIRSLEIVEVENVGYVVGEKEFKNRREAEEYVVFIKGLQ